MDKPMIDKEMRMAQQPVSTLIMVIPYRIWLAFLAILLGWSIQPAPLNAAPPLQTSDTATDATTVYLLTFTGPVTPILESYLGQAIRNAETTGAAAVILQLDTPGGSVEVTQSIVRRMLASPIPLVVYVAPAGARAGSAGTFITLAAHIAAMAPNTSIGAASPVGLGGDVDPTLAEKITNILSADIENLAARRGEEATEWAIAAVQEAAAATAQEALELGVIDLIATDIDDLLSQIDGRSVTLPSGTLTLNVSNARVIVQDMTALQRVLNLLVDPNLATILLSLGIIGLVVEIRTPGINVAGILGIICLLLALYGLGQLDANLTGLTFMLIALGLFIAEAFTPTFGVLAAGGIIAFLLGGALLFDTPGISTPWTAMIIVALIMGGLTILVGHQALTAQQRPVLTGAEALIGSTGIAKETFRAGETGYVFVQGEWWNARTNSGEIAANTPVRILDIDGLTLIVAPITDAIANNAQPPSAGQNSTEKNLAQKS